MREFTHHGMCYFSNTVSVKCSHGGNICLILHFTKLCENIYQLWTTPIPCRLSAWGNPYTMSALSLGLPSYHVSCQLEATLILCQLAATLILCQLPNWGYPHTMSACAKSHLVIEYYGFSCNQETCLPY